MIVEVVGWCDVEWRERLLGAGFKETLSYLMALILCSSTLYRVVHLYSPNFKFIAPLIS